MERAIAEMEKIRRAEEIYSRRKNGEDEQKRLSSKSIYKFLFEILLLINIVIIIVAVQNQKYIFTEDFIKQVNSYNVNIKKKFEELLTTTPSNTITNNDKENNNTINENDGVSGESNNLSSGLVESQQIIEKELSQEEKDILEIKENYSIALPLSGTKTSGFGERESTNSKVTKNHTGVDIAASLRNSYKLCNFWNSGTSFIRGRLWQTYQSTNRQSNCFICTLFKN